MKTLSVRILAPFILLPLVLVMALPTAASAQSASASASASPGASQYANGLGSAAAANGAAKDTGDIPPAFSDNVTNGAEVVNETMSGSGRSAAQASVPADPVPTTSASAGSSSLAPAAADPAAANPAAEDLTTLPETGGAPLLALGAGLLLVAGGLCARRLLRR